MPGESMESPCPIPNTSLYASLPSGCSSFFFLINLFIYFIYFFNL